MAALHSAASISIQSAVRRVEFSFVLCNVIQDASGCWVLLRACAYAIILTQIQQYEKRNRTGLGGSGIGPRPARNTADDAYGIKLNTAW